MMEFRVTFPYRYATEQHPVVPTAHPDGWLAIEADGFRTAWTIVSELMGCKWNGFRPVDELSDEEWEFCFPRGEIARWLQPSEQTLTLAEEMLTAAGLCEHDRDAHRLAAAVWLEGWVAGGLRAAA